MNLFLAAILFILIIIILSIITNQINNPFNKSSFNISSFANTNQPFIPYLSHNIYINIFIPSPEQYNKFKYLYKATLTRNLLITDGNNNVFIPSTVKNIPIQLLRGSDKLKYSIVANGIEKEIQPTDIILTTF